MLIYGAKNTLGKTRYFSLYLTVSEVIISVTQMIYKLDAQQCIIRGEYSIRDMMLHRHTFIEEKTGIWLNCLDKCDDDVRCQSFKYVISQGICELNNRTKEAKPEDFLPESDRFYINRFRERGIFLFGMLISIFFFLDSALFLRKCVHNILASRGPLTKPAFFSSKELNNGGV